MNKRTIITIHEHPPIPVSPFWRAFDDSLGADCSPIGEGKTEFDVVRDLLDHLEDHKE